jgi:hypothetical protein
VSLAQVRVDHREQVDGRQLRGVSLSIHQTLNHLDDLLLHVLDIDQGQYVLDALNSLYTN